MGILPGGMEWIIIGAAVLLFFGGKKIPEMMKGLGKGIKEFKDASATDEAGKLDESKKESSNK
jgi:sec-independent protein translocase protein TatA